MKLKMLAEEVILNREDDCVENFISCSMTVLRSYFLCTRC